jgi:hypothetical protein
MTTGIKDAKRIFKLQNFSKEHLFYDIWMLYEVTFKLSLSISDGIIANAMVESFVIHATLILDFLFNIKDKESDSVADDYLVDPLAWRKLSSVHRKKFDFVWQRRNKEIAHLSYERLGITPQEKLWNFVAIAREISDLVDLFIDSASKDLLSVEVINLKGIYRGNLLWRFAQNFNSAPMRNNG